MGTAIVEGHDLTVLGDLVIDLILPIDALPLRAEHHGWAQGLFPELGGSCNSVVAARRLGLSTVVLGMVGSDGHGRQLREMLKAEGADTSQVVICRTRQTVLCLVVCDRKGQYTYLGIKDDGGTCPSPPRWTRAVRRSRSLLTYGYAFRELLGQADVLGLMSNARQAGVPVFFDPGPSGAELERELLRQALRRTDVLLLTLEEATLLVGSSSGASDAGRGLLEHGPRLVVIKLGQDGCFITDGTTEVQHPGYPVEPVDAVGAGDAFDAAFIAGYLRGGSMRDCAALANAMGALTVTVQGAGRRIPPTERLVELLASDPAKELLAPAKTDDRRRGQR